MCCNHVINKLANPVIININNFNRCYRLAYYILYEMIERSNQIFGYADSSGVPQKCV